MAITKIVTYETKAYSSFEKINGNRIINKNNVRNIVESIKTNGLKPTIVIVNEKLEIIDGQHRVEALKELNLPVYYQVYKGLTLQDCIALNTSSRKWTLMDYALSYAETNDHYKELIRLGEKYKKEFTINNIVSILNAKTLSRSGDLIKSGNLKLSLMLDEAENKLDTISTYMLLLSNLTGRKEIMIGCLAKLLLIPDIDTDRLTDSIEKYGYQVTGIVSVNNCLEKLEEIYNYNRRNKVRFISKYHEMFDDNRDKK